MSLLGTRHCAFFMALEGNSKNAKQVLVEMHVLNLPYIPYLRALYIYFSHTC